jgi:GTP-binding protein HflX
VLLRLDAMSAIEAGEDGLPGLVRTAYLSPSTNGDSKAAAWDSWSRHAEPDRPDFVDFITELENEFARNAESFYRADGGAGDPGGGNDRERRGGERAISRSRGARPFSDVVVLDTIVQRRPKLDPRYLVGKGKIEELSSARSRRADLIIFTRRCNRTRCGRSGATDLKILDRTQLILDICEARPEPRGKLQVELAQLRYMLPRLTEMDTALSRLTGGIGGRGPGETKLEMDRRRVRDRIARLQKEIQSIRRKRGERRKMRVSRGFPSSPSWATPTRESRAS